MRTKLSWVFGSVLVAAFAFAGCSSDEEDNKNNTGGAGGSGGQTTDGGGGSGGEGDGGETVTGACTNAEDKAAGRAGYCPGNRSVSQIVSACAKDCLLSEEEGCVRDCVEEDLKGALSEDCRDCYIDLTACGSANCASVCLADTSSNECISCLCGENKKEKNCYAAFNECTGLGVTYCEDVANGTFEGYPEPEPAAECGEGDAGDGDAE